MAKKYHTTEDRIMETNNLPDKNVTPGQKIVVVKEIM
ncbi:MAG: LysM peptidoglycan-binding domain-containing protein [Clostridiales bacterium]|nr:LysM peptidoglycan-binding domain-containing protein [Clostridiales bacterium]